jgi:hypothetical protein
MSEVLTHSVTKVVRPFKGLEAIAAALGGAGFRLRENGELITDDSIVVPVEDAGTIRLEAVHNLDRLALIDNLEQLGVAPNEVEVVLIATIGALKRSEVVHRIVLADLDDLSIDLTEATRSYVGVHGGFQIVFALTLKHDLPPKPLMPSGLGQWLSRKVVTIKPEQPNYEFKILPLTAEVRDRLKLPAGTTHFIETRGSINDPDTALSEAVVVYFEEAIYNAFGRSASGAASTALQKSFLADIAAGMIIQEMTDEDPSVAPGSALDQFFADLSKTTKKDRTLLETWARSDHAMFKAHVHAAIDLNQSVRAAL